MHIRVYQDTDLEVLKTLSYCETDLKDLAILNPGLSMAQAVTDSITASTEVLIIENDQAEIFGVVGVAETAEEPGMGILWGLFTEEAKQYKREWLKYDQRIIDWLSQGYDILANWTMQDNSLLRRLRKIGFTVTVINEVKGIVFFWKEVKEGD